MRQRAKDEGFEETLQHIVKLRLRAKDGHLREMDCATRVTVLRLLQSIPSPKVEPVKVWLANVGERTLEEFDEAAADIQRVEEATSSVGTMTSGSKRGCGSWSYETVSPTPGSSGERRRAWSLPY